MVIDLKKFGKTMELPNGSPKFTEKTLLIAMNHDRAKTYSVDGNHLTIMGEIHTEDTEYEYTDNESQKHISGPSGGAFASKGNFPKTGGETTNPGSEPHNKEHYLAVFLNYFTKEVQKIMKLENFARLIIFAPANIHKLLNEKLSPHLQKKANIIPANLYKHHPFDLIERIKNNPKIRMGTEKY